jgi:hypothetical protein
MTYQYHSTILFCSVQNPEPGQLQAPTVHCHSSLYSDQHFPIIMLRFLVSNIFLWCSKITLFIQILIKSPVTKFQHRV